jgi:A1 cistron-splicing factor AAR2
VGTKFKGIKVIPLGTHIITYSLETENYMFPINKFIFFGEDQEERIRVFRWNTKAERFVGLRGEEAEGYREGVKKYHFDCYLGPYPQENVEFWSCNTKYITKAVLDKLDPI